MSTVTTSKRVVTTARLKMMKQAGKKITMLTAYEYTMAKIMDAAGVLSLLATLPLMLLLVTQPLSR